MLKKKKVQPQEEFSSPDTNPELNTDLEEKNEVFSEDDLDLIFDINADDDLLNDDLIQEDEND